MPEIKTRLIPPETKGHTSVAKLTRYWYAACAASELRGRKPKAITLMGTPLVLFRNEKGQVGALLDRCPHRNVPLSMGEVKGEHLECAYHGWRFGTDGACGHVPGLPDQKASKGRRAAHYATRELDDMIWVYGEPDVEPETEPYRFPHVGDPSYTTVYRRVEAEASVHATIENALDVPHTAFLHKGLFRGNSDPNEIEVVMRRWRDRVEAEYIGEPRPEGVVGRILSPSGGVVTHFDRFILPSIAEVEYKIGEENHILVTSACTPVSDFHTHLHAVVSFKLRIPHAAVKPLLGPLALMIFNQDKKMLKRQTETIRQFGGEQYTSTDLDVLGPQIWRLMTQAERGNTPTGDEPVIKKTTMLV